MTINRVALDQRLHVITTMSMFGAMGMAGFERSAVGLGQNWPLADLALFIPVSMPFTFAVRRLGHCVGTTNTGNIDLGIYDPTGNLIVATGATALGTASQTQWIDCTDTVLTPGDYFLAMSHNGTTSHRSAVIAVATASRGAMLGVLEMASAHPLPNPATMVASTRANIPIIGVAGVASP